MIKKWKTLKVYTVCVCVCPLARSTHNPTRKNPFKYATPDGLFRPREKSQ